MGQGRMWVVIAGLTGALAVAFGAYQAHGLELYLERMGVHPDEVAKQIVTCDTGVRYQFWHALGLLGIAALASRFESRILNLAGIGILLGTVLFSGTLYYIALSGDRSVGRVAATGGMILIVSWVLLALSAPFLRPREET